MTVILNAHILSPADNLDINGNILIKDGMVSDIMEGSIKDFPADAKVIDAKGAYAAPGFVDVHTHFRDPGQTEKEDIHSGAQAAAAGGYTTVICMANTVPAVDSIETLSYVKEKASGENIHILQCASVTVGREGKELTDFGGLLKAGAAGFTDDGSPVMDENLVKTAMKNAASLNAVLSFHEEAPEYVGVAGINEGKVSEEMGIRGADREAEISMVKRDLPLALESGCRIDIQHVSARETVELIREAKKKDSLNLIHAEATPNHFSMTEDHVRKHGSLVKINPPLRTEEDRRAIIEGLKDGTIDLIANDHAPHTIEDKRKEFPKCMSGIIGLETAFSLGIKNLIDTGDLALEDLITLMSVNPAAVYGLDAGHIRIGHPADIVIFDPKEHTLYDHFKSKAVNSPFLGSNLPGRILHTIAGGKIVY